MKSFALLIALLPAWTLSLPLLAADTVVDNDSVRILKAVDEPGKKSPMHKHDFDRVMIYLDAGHIVVGHPDGNQDHQHWSKGQVEWSPVSGLHTSENTGSIPIRIIEIELKKPAPVQPTRRDSKLDPVAIDPGHNLLLFENPKVRVFRSWREPGGSEKMHQHVGAGRASVLLTRMDAVVQSADGSKSEQHGEAGDVNWSGPVTHATTNTGINRLEMVVIEVK